MPHSVFCSSACPSACPSVYYSFIRMVPTFVRFQKFYSGLLFVLQKLHFPSPQICVCQNFFVSLHLIQTQIHQPYSIIYYVYNTNGKRKQNLVRDKCTISALLVRSKCVTLVHLKPVRTRHRTPLRRFSSKKMSQNLRIPIFFSNFAAQNCMNRRPLEGKSDGETGGDSGSGGVYEGVVTRLLCAVLECDCGVVDGA